MHRMIQIRRTILNVLRYFTSHFKYIALFTSRYFKIIIYKSNI